MQLNGCQTSVTEMPVYSSLRPDLPPWRESHCLCLEWRNEKSGRSEPAIAIYATDPWHPFSCSLSSGPVQLQLFYNLTAGIGQMFCYYEEDPEKERK